MPNSEGAVDDRVDREIRWAEKCIALLTPDERSPYGAPNVLDEIGRWRGSKGKASLCILRHAEVPVASNHGGIVYLAFGDRVRETFDPLRDFLDDEASSSAPESVTESDSFAIDASPQRLLVDGELLTFARIEENQDEMTVTLTEVSGSAEAFVRSLRDHAHLQLAFGNRASPASLTERRFVQEGSLSAVLSFRLRARDDSSALLDVNTPSFTADDFAAMRAGRILADEPLPAAMSHDPTLAMFVDGESSACRIPDVLRGQPRTRETWEVLRLLLVQQLLMEGGFDQVHRLSLTVIQGRLKQVDFEGNRHGRFSGARSVIRLSLSTDF